MSTPTASITLYLGGVRAGKSAKAQRHGESIDGAHRVFVATAQAFDEEMAQRIRLHQADRAERWHTIEEPVAVTAALSPYLAARAPTHGTNVVVLIDCLTLWVSNLLLAMPDTDHALHGEQRVADATHDLVALMQAHQDVHWMVVSNEVGLGVVPPTPLGRAYRDALGRANQIVAQAAHHVQLMVAGLELPLK